MQSTGEVIGLHTDPRVALAKAMQGAALIPPRPGADGALALVSIAERDLPSLPRVAAALARAGYRFAATEGTAAALAHLGYEAQVVAKVGEPQVAGRVSILDLIAGGKVRLVVNTPSPKSGPVRDAAEIRLAATAMGILCLTAIETAVAAAEALDPDLRTRLAEVRSLGEWVPEPGKPRRAISFG
jgi:carbamoyl-phosphate synthase large subunit